MVEMKELPKRVIDSEGYPDYDKIRKIAEILIIKGNTEAELI
jgi:hypothetical protein